MKTFPQTSKELADYLQSDSSEAYDKDSLLKCLSSKEGEDLLAQIIKVLNFINRKEDFLCDFRRAILNFLSLPIKTKPNLKLLDEYKGYLERSALKLKKYEDSLNKYFGSDLRITFKGGPQDFLALSQAIDSALKNLDYFIDLNEPKKGTPFNDKNLKLNIYFLYNVFSEYCEDYKDNKQKVKISPLSKEIALSPSTKANKSVGSQIIYYAKPENLTSNVTTALGFGKSAEAITKLVKPYNGVKNNPRDFT
jgi:hypothetical protein